MYRSHIDRQHTPHNADIDGVVDVFLVDDVNVVVVVIGDTEDDSVDIGDNVHVDDVICNDDVVWHFNSIGTKIKREIVINFSKLSIFIYMSLIVSKNFNWICEESQNLDKWRSSYYLLDMP